MKKIAALALMAGVAFAASAAQDSVGYLSVIKGNISIGGQGFATKAAHGTPLVDGSTVMVPTNGRATVVLNNGCHVDLTGSQHFTVNSKLPCSQLQASVTQMFDAHRVAQAPVGGSGSLLGGGLGAGATTGAVIGVVGIVSVVAFAAVKNDEVTSGS